MDYLDIDDGLSNNNVRCIYQDHKGFMWIGTRDGLNRFDGYNFKTFRNKFNIPNSLVSNSISTIVNDIDNNLWIGTLHGISVYNDLFGEFSTVSYHSLTGQNVPIREVVRNILPDKKGNVFIGTEGLGLLYCKKGSLVAEQVPLIVNGNETKKYGIQSVKISRNGIVWVFVQNLGLGKLDYRTRKISLVDTTVSLATCLEMDENNIWIGSNKGLYRYDALLKTMIGPLKPIADKSIFSLAIDRNRNLWIGTHERGIYSYNLNEKKLNPVVGSSTNYMVGAGTIYAIYIDKDGRKWIGTSLMGINVVDPHKSIFKTIRHEPGNRNSLSNNAVSAMFEDTESKLWIGTENFGLNVWNRKVGSFELYTHNPANPESISGNYITSVLQDYKNDIWVGTFFDGINRYNRSSNSFKRYKCVNPESGIESVVVFDLFEDREKMLWAATLRRGSLLGGLYRLNREKDVFELFDLRLSDLFSITEDSAGNLWGGNLSELVQVDKKNKKHNFYSIGFLVRDIKEDRQGHLWLGTEDGGLLLFDRKLKKIVKRYTTHDGLCSNSVLTITDDDEGNLWLTTFNGVSRFNLKDRSFKNFYQNDGLQSNQFQFNSALKLRSNEMVFGGIKGFNLFQPSAIKTVNSTPKLLLTNIAVNNVSIEDDRFYVSKKSSDKILELKVPYDKAVFSFGFTALEYSSPNKIKYAYFMEGWDRSWNNNGEERTAVYTHIDEGHYVFRVRCTNPEGNWGSQEIQLRIIVLPPWYRSWWAYLGYLCITASLVYVYLLYRAKQTKLKYEVKIANLNAQREKAEYERERSEREKEKVINEKEKELTEKRLSFFTNVSHEFRTPLTLIINPVKDLIEKFNSRQPEDNKELNIVYRNARRLLSLVDQLLLFRKTDTGSDRINASQLNFYDLCKEVYLCFVQQANVKNIQYDFVFENDDLQVFADREKVEIILFNLISNALKYTPTKGRVIFRVSETNEEVLVAVEDTGHGIPEDAGTQLFERFYQAKRTDNFSKPGFGIGLYLAKQFTEAHNGELYYESKLGLGTIFYFKLLKGYTHLPDVNFADEGTSESVLLNELLPADFLDQEEVQEMEYQSDDLVSDQQSILIVDDEKDIRKYIKSIFKSSYLIYEAENGEDGLKIAGEKLPDLIITDFKMQGIDGIELCEKIKADPALSYIPVILLTASSSQDLKLKSMQGGADDYIGKPFEKAYLIARVANLLKNRNHLQRYFYNEITLQSNVITISEEYKKFLDRCIVIVEQHLNDPDFGIQALADEIGMSHSNLYKRVKSISGQSVSAFIRFIRLRKAAEIMINTEYNVNEVAFETGFNDSKYFSKQFLKVFQLNPSEFIKKHRKSFTKRYKVKNEIKKRP
ncbi:response regulator [Pedobacter sp. MC2016-14]|uniref:hybrid sensor histidine kinase/response regulator transcription factor n=1 Tax=Pedobacter sp. MC2016-14 TaxID=2897327 RepID=UPI001E5AC821|nr:hybrid sensor histidine kinase/response regulator [Pedobacter sp. MC2016-14]MCD0487621.1 response regulator [Pedobacter sp. MC2016-14]